MSNTHRGDDGEVIITIRGIFNAMLASRQLQPAGEDGEGRSSMHQVFTPDELRRLRTLGVLSGASQDQVDRFVDPSLTMEDDGDDDDYEDPEEYQNSEVYDYDEDYLPSPPHTRTSGKWFHPPKEPTKEGLELLMGGEYGRIGHQLKSRNQMNSLYKTLSTSRSRVRPSPQEDIAADLLPNSNGVAVASYAANAYVGQYSSDSSFYYTCVRDFRLHVYDTTAPLTIPDPINRRNHDGTHTTSMKIIKTIQAQPDRWTITDSHLSPDNQRMIYATVSNNIYMTSTLDSSPVQTAINFSDPPNSRGRMRNVFYHNDEEYGLWSCKFSADGNEVVAGGREMIFVYDLVGDKRVVKIKAHEDDINSCCWADTTSGNILVSASDDSFIKIWDRRSLGTSEKPSGVLIGHTEGITYVSAKGDGRYVVSNGKDQILRLWDLRKMRSSHEFEEVEHDYYGIPNFDYRAGIYPKPINRAHPLDCSVMQYTGHSVLRTLIRCHFSPSETTGGQYIYSGSADGKIHIWSLDGRVVQVLDRSYTLPISFDPSGPIPQYSGIHPKACVRDVSWHSQQPILMSAGWLGTGWSSREGSVIARHEWKGLSKMNYNLSDHVKKQKLERDERAKRRSFLSSMPGSFEMAGHSDSDGDA